MNKILTAYVLYFLLWTLGVIGYIINIIKILGAWGDPMTTGMIVRLVGVIAFPLGAVAGWF